MVWKTVDDLKTSDLYKRSGILQKMGTQKLKVFLEIFTRVFERAARGGASKEEAEARAFPIALVGAQRYAYAPADRVAEKEVAVFSLYAQEMEHGSSISNGADTNMRFPAIEDINDVMAGQVFFGPYTHDRDLAEPQGVIHRVMRRVDLPDDLKVKVDPGILLVAEASFYSDVPQAERFATISPEWTTVSFTGGEKLHIPTNFITTDEPANDAIMGIGRVAAKPSGNGYEGHDAVEGARDTMPTAVEELQAKVATLQKKADAFEEAATKAKEFEDKLANLEKDHKSLSKTHEDYVAKVAALSGHKPPEGSKPDETKALSGLEARLATLQADVDKLNLQAKQAEADAWAEKVVRAKEIALDAKPKLASLFVTAKQAALDLEASLPERIVKPGDAKAHRNATKLEGKQAEEHAAFIKGAF